MERDIGFLDCQDAINYGLNDTVVHGTGENAIAKPPVIHDNGVVAQPVGCQWAQISSLSRCD